MEKFTPTQARSIELVRKMLPFLQGEDFNAVSGALTFHLGMMVGKVAKTEAEAAKLGAQISGDITRTALDIMGDGHADA